MSGFDLSTIIGSLPFLLEGLGLSMVLTVVAMVGGLILGLFIAIVRLSRLRLVAGLATLYVNGFRAVPLILVIFWFYFLVPVALGRPVGALYSVLVAFVMFEGAYYSEIMRAGLQSVRRTVASREGIRFQLSANCQAHRAAASIADDDAAHGYARSNPVPGHCAGLRRFAARFHDVG